jgi:hypothetical protein
LLDGARSHGLTHLLLRGRLAERLPSIPGKLGTTRSPAGRRTSTESGPTRRLSQRRACDRPMLRIHYGYVTNPLSNAAGVGCGAGASVVVIPFRNLLPSCGVRATRSAITDKAVGRDSDRDGLRR